MQPLTIQENGKFKILPSHKIGIHSFKMDHLKQQVQEVKTTQELAQKLMELPHYKKIGEAQLFLIVENAIALGIDPRKALNGGLYAVNGKVEMSGRLMGELIRRRGHSFRTLENTKDKCVLIGKRADTGDEEKVSFSIEEAKKAGIYHASWEKFPEDMLYWRALSRLARRLFPDVIGGCYVEGELQEDPPSKPCETAPETIQAEPIPIETITKEQEKELQHLIGQFPAVQEKAQKLLDYFEVSSFDLIPKERFDRLKSQLESQLKKLKEENHG